MFVLSVFFISKMLIRNGTGVLHFFSRSPGGGPSGHSFLLTSTTVLQPQTSCDETIDRTIEAEDGGRLVVASGRLEPNRTRTVKKAAAASGRWNGWMAWARHGCVAWLHVINARTLLALVCRGARPPARPVSPSPARAASVWRLCVAAGRPRGH